MEIGRIPNTQNNFRAEAIAILRTLQTVTNTTPIKIITDTLSVKQAIEKKLENINFYFIYNEEESYINSIAGDIIQLIIEIILQRPNNTIIEQTKAYVKTIGNEIVNKLTIASLLLPNSVTPQLNNNNILKVAYNNQIIDTSLTTFLTNAPKIIQKELWINSKTTPPQNIEKTYNNLTSIRLNKKLTNFAISAHCKQLPTNKKLFKIKHIESEICNICNKEIETIHYALSCNNSANIINYELCNDLHNYILTQLNNKNLIINNFVMSFGKIIFQANTLKIKINNCSNEHNEQIEQSNHCVIPKEWIDILKNNYKINNEKTLKKILNYTLTKLITYKNQIWINRCKLITHKKPIHKKRKQFNDYINMPLNKKAKIKSIPQIPHIEAVEAKKLKLINQ